MIDSTTVSLTVNLTPNTKATTTSRMPVMSGLLHDNNAYSTPRPTYRLKNRTLQSTSETQTQNINLATTTQKVKDTTRIPSPAFNAISNSTFQKTRPHFIPFNLSIEIFITGIVLISLASFLTCCFLWKILHKKRKKISSVFPSRANVSLLFWQKCREIKNLVICSLPTKTGTRHSFSNHTITRDQCLSSKSMFLLLPNTRLLLYKIFGGSFDHELQL